MIDKVFWQISRRGRDVLAAFNQGKAFENVKMILDSMIKNGVWMQLILDPTLRNKFTQYLVNDSMCMEKETECDKNLLFLIEEMIYRDQSN